MTAMTTSAMADATTILNVETSLSYSEAAGLFCPAASNIIRIFVGGDPIPLPIFYLNAYLLG